MTIIEMRTMQIICSSLPEIAKQLKRIADEAFCSNQMSINKSLERKENGNETSMETCED